MTARYDIIMEEEKVGRKTERQYAIYDSVEDKVIARYQNEKDARSILVNYENAMGL